MSGDEFDYMSDDVLVGSSKEDIRPGLLQNRSEKRKKELAEKKEISDKMNKTKSLWTIQKESLMVGLQNPLHSTNKGFAMLEKMGYKPGSSLGRDGQGITEPVPVPVFRNFREGLGVKAALQEMRLEKRKQNQAKQKKEISIQDFRSRMSEEISEREAGIDLSKSQKSCYSLDTAKEKEVHSTLSNASLLNLPSRKAGKIVSLAILPEFYPAHLLSKEEFEELHTQLSDCISNISLHLDPKPQFKNFQYKVEQGLLEVECVGKHSKTWLCQIIKEGLSLSSGLKFITEKPLVATRKLTCSDVGLFLPEQIRKDKLIKRLCIQNPELDFKQWKITSTVHQRKSTYYFLTFSIPNHHSKVLESLGNTLYYGFWKVNVFHLKPEDITNTIPNHLQSYVSEKTFSLVPETAEERAEAKELLRELATLCN